jgi:hypothetical protein
MFWFGSLQAALGMGRGIVFLLIIVNILQHNMDSSAGSKQQNGNKQQASLYAELS